MDTNLPRNSWPQTYQDDKTPDQSRKRLLLATATARSATRSIGLLLVRQRNETGFPSFLKPVALAPNVNGGRMVQQTIEDGGGDDRVAEDRTPFAVALVGSENDAASFVTGADELKEDCRAEFVQRISSMTTLGAK